MALMGLAHQNATTHALPGYYCKNKGHRPMYVPFTQVNDGVCDYAGCCDGSDEWAGVGGVKCDDRCKEIGKQWRSKDEARKKAMAAGIKRRQELVDQAKSTRKKLEGDIVIAESKVKEAELKAAQLQAALAETEKKEKGKIVKGAGGKLSALVTLAKDRVEELREALTIVRNQRDVAFARVHELEDILTTFKGEYNPNFNDDGVKRAVRSWEEYAARKDDPADDEFVLQETDLDHIVKPDGSEDGVGIHWQDWLAEEMVSEVDSCECPDLVWISSAGKTGWADFWIDGPTVYNIQAYLPGPLREWIHEKSRHLREWLAQNGMIAESESAASTGMESKTLQAARNALQLAETALSDHRSALVPLQEDLARDHGPDDVFRALKGTCISTDSGEYTYELCFMDRATQKPLAGRGGSNTHMGTFVGFDVVYVDGDDDDDDGYNAITYQPGGQDPKDTASGGRTVDGKVKRLAMKYEKGQHCWNGPVRSTTVVLSCAEKDSVMKVVEEEKCVYRMDVGSTAVCYSQGSKADAAGATVVDGVAVEDVRATERKQEKGTVGGTEKDKIAAASSKAVDASSSAVQVGDDKRDEL